MTYQFHTVDTRPGRPFTLDDEAALRAALSIYPDRPRILIASTPVLDPLRGALSDQLRDQLWTLGAIPVTYGPHLASRTISPGGLHFATPAEDAPRAPLTAADWDYHLTASRVPSARADMTLAASRVFLARRMESTGEVAR